MFSYIEENISSKYVRKFIKIIKQTRFFSGVFNLKKIKLFYLKKNAN